MRADARGTPSNSAGSRYSKSLGCALCARNCAINKRAATFFSTRAHETPLSSGDRVNFARAERQKIMMRERASERWVLRVYVCIDVEELEVTSGGRETGRLSYRGVDGSIVETVLKNEF